jgi:carbamoyl-phosphate synthase small subunit
MNGRWDATLYLESGSHFEGIGFGSETSRGGEAVFNTGMTGYQEIFTDPSYLEQIVVMSYPHIGNTGVNAADWESRGVFLSGVVVREYCGQPSSWRSESPLDVWLKHHKVPGISDVDTRQITEILRDKGAQRAVIFPTSQAGGKPESHGKTLLSKVASMEGLELVSRVSCQSPYLYAEDGTDDGMRAAGPGVIVVYDYGAKTNILRFFRETGYQVWVVPYNYPHKDVLALKPNAVVLSNGPGDPGQVAGAVEEIQGLIGQVPMLAICMGHQLLARSLGAKTYKLEFGHHGVNHPVLEAGSGKVLITSQNHGFSVKAEDLRQKDVEIDYVSLNDQTVEGFSSKKMKLCSVQFHPEAKPGPNDAQSIFDHFVRGFVK